MNEFQSLPTVNSCIISPGNLEGLQDVNNPIIKVEIKEEIEIKEAFDICTPGKEAYLTCFHCEEEFFNLIDLRTHIKKCHLLTAGCLLSACSRVSSTENQEGLQDTDNPIIKAEIKEEFDTFKDIFTYGEEAYFACFHCQEEFFNLRDLRIHIKKCHLEPVGCLVSTRDLSPSVFTTKKGNRRQITCTGYYLNETGKRTRKKKYVRSKTATANENLPKNLITAYDYFTSKQPCKSGSDFPCPKCDHESTRLANLEDHLKSKHNDDKPYSCPFCDHRTSRLGDLKRHFISKHTSVKSFACSFCDYKTSRKSTLKRHLMANHNSHINITKIFSCPHCAYSGIRSDHVITHSKYVHHSGKSVDCSYRGCNESRKSLNKRSKKVECPHCMKIVSDSYLKRHLQSLHYKEVCSERIFSCPHCSFNSIYLSSLRYHMRAHHTKEKPFSCNYCEFKSAWPKSLKKHIKNNHNGPV